MRRLVVCADDVGLDPGITAGALEARRDGIVTDLSMHVARDDWGRTVTLLREAGVTEVGVHLTLCEGRPVLDAHEVPSLLVEGGRFPRSGRRILARHLTGRVRASEVRKEWLAQVRRAQSAGFRVTHLDGHKHLHLLPGLFGIALDTMQGGGVPAMRLPREPRGSERSLVRGLLGALSIVPGGKLRRGTVVTTDRAAGIAEAGALSEARLLGILEQLPAGTTELVCHPGRTGGTLPDRLVNEGLAWARDYRWDVEREALQSERVRALVADRGIELVSWSALR
ncbi:MAG: ChbG/HpnK family deacetylase [Proteobacteria bacterium]|nr:ChbG/HpnK family deacetylase [Pseudomonadota bacterium]